MIWRVLLTQFKWRGKHFFWPEKWRGRHFFWRKKWRGKDFFVTIHKHGFSVIGAFLSNAGCRMFYTLRYCPVYYYLSLRIVIIPFLYDLKSAFDSIQMKGQTLFLTRKMTGHTLFLTKKMSGHGLFSRGKIKGLRLFSRRKNFVCPA